MDYEILKSKDWVENSGCYPSRVVLLKIKKGNVFEYSTHIQANPEKDGLTPYVFWGHYYIDLKDAENDFDKREV